MIQSMTSFVVGLAVLLVIAFVFARYMHAHPEETMTRWLDAHHMGWIHHKH